MRGRRAIAIAVLVVGVLILAVVAVVFVLQSGDEGSIEADPSSTPAAETSGEGEDVAGEATPDAAAAVGTPTPQQFEFSDPNAPEAELVDVVVSLQTVPRGWLMTEAELRTEKRLASEVGPNVVTSIEDVVGRYARNDIFQGETITTDALVIDPTLIGEETFGPSSLIPFGFLGLSISTDRLSSVAYALQPGDSVDIMASFVFFSVDEDLESLLPNNATILIIEENEEGEVTQSSINLTPYGRFEQLPTGAIAHVSPQEAPRPILVSFVIQNARIIQVGAWDPPGPVQPPTPTPDPNAAETPTPAAATATPALPESIVVALPPQQQLLLKQALERGADVDLALRAANDGQINNIENVTFDYVTNRFNIELPASAPYEAIGMHLIVTLNQGCTDDGLTDVLPYYCTGTLLGGETSQEGQ